MKKIDLPKVIVVLFKQGLTRKQIAKELNIAIEDTSIMPLIIEMFKQGSLKEDILKKLAISLEIFDEEIRSYFSDTPVNIQGKVAIDTISDSFFEEHFEHLILNIKSLDISVRCMNCLRAAEHRYLWQIISDKIAELRKFRNFGKSSVEELEQIVNSFGFAFEMKFTESQIARLKAATIEKQ